MKIKQLNSIPADKNTGLICYSDKVVLSELVREISAICCLGFNESPKGWVLYFKSAIRNACGVDKGQDYRCITRKQLDMVLHWIADVEASIIRSVKTDIINRLNISLPENKDMETEKILDG